LPIDACGVKSKGDDMRRLLRPAVIPLIAVAALFVLLVPSSAVADPPPGPYFNGFETNTAGWFTFSGATVTRQPSGYMTGPGGYANGINSASGNYHARLGIDPSPDSCTFGGGIAPIYYGPYTNWGGYSSIFPTGGYFTRLDIYLDVQWAQAHPDKRFDWASAINNTSGMHRRDFVFNAGTDPLGFVISGGNNSTRCGANPADPGHAPVQVSLSGWYTFEHAFTGVAGGPLVVVMRLINKSTNAVVGTWVRSDPTDIIGVTVGGNRYGWFVQNEIDDLAIDNSERTGIVGTSNCEIKISDGGKITAVNGDDGTFGGNAKVSATGASTGEQTYHDHGPLQPLDFKALTVDTVICDQDEMTAEIYGMGSVDGAGSYQYRIKVDDEGEPGTDDKYGIVIAGSPPFPGYASGDQQLEGGNIQIRFG
jgi:hypothetical protein